MQINLRYMTAPRSGMRGEYLERLVELPDGLRIEQLVKKLGAEGLSPVDDGVASRELLTEGPIHPNGDYQLGNYNILRMDRKVERLSHSKW
jgi:hypothetical protein